MVFAPLPRSAWSFVPPQDLFRWTITIEEAPPRRDPTPLLGQPGPQPGQGFALPALLPEAPSQPDLPLAEPIPTPPPVELAPPPPAEPPPLPPISALTEAPWPTWERPSWLPSVLAWTPELPLPSPPIGALPVPPEDVLLTMFPPATAPAPRQFPADPTALLLATLIAYPHSEAVPPAPPQPLLAWPML